MMKVILFFALVGCATCAPKYVFELLKKALTAEEIQTVLNDRAEQWPTYASIPQTNFKCSDKKQAGFYADQETQCQVFHRCTLDGVQKDFLCSNRTVFNQITLTCDDFWNVECEKSKEFEDFANSRLYTNLPLFDSPPADWILDNSGAVQGQANGQPLPVSGKPANKPNGGKPPAVPLNPAGKSLETDGSAASADASMSVD
jgi:hypothetical protein